MFLKVDLVANYLGGKPDGNGLVLDCFAIGSGGGTLIIELMKKIALVVQDSAQHALSFRIIVKA